ncbi:MAG: diguanylate cyclase [Acidobacteriota bacterium]
MGKRTSTVLIVGPESLSRRISELLGDQEYSVQRMASDKLIPELQICNCVLVVLDFSGSQQDEGPLVDQVAESHPWLSVVVVKEGDGNPNMDSLKHGVYFYLTHSVRSKTLEWVLRKGVERSHLLAENASLRQKVLSDDLTEAYNRRYMEITLDEELERASRYQRFLSILFVDLNHLKDINDRYGHLSGSKVIRRVAGLLQMRLRSCDKIFRFGGDEFVVTLPETDADQAGLVVQRLADALNRDEIQLPDGADIIVTAAFGIATYPVDGTNKEELIEHADEAMYRCKVEMHKADVGD